MLFHQSSPPAAPATEAGPPPSVRHTFLKLRMVGLTQAEAGNLTAHLTGLRVARQAWTVTEIERLMFLRSIVESGRLQS